METESLVSLVPLGREHLDASRTWANDAALNAAMLRVLPASSSDQERWFASIDGNPSKLVFAIIWRETSCHIGNVGLYHIDWLHRRAEFWIFIGEAEYRGRKAGAQATSLMRRLAFEGLGLNRLSLRVDAANRRAIALYGGQGFIQEGVLREESYVEGRFRDVLIMSQLKREYDQRQREGGAGK